ncbi:hypothetical protein MiSe_34350 [Microseira wollei NIES-4236]|uniref:Uncharacterized protein n=1 Tax=Microseira wollei NIES-4236 TaxID=2530354 RepID=A0AAV3XBA2_9CYAN|nr:hypothetical protein MiSe_34350 [Microseira wollei NIES-4236]
MSGMQIYANTHQGCGYTNEAREGGLKHLKPALAGFVCVATPCAGVGFRVSATLVDIFPLRSQVLKLPTTLAEQCY